MKKQTRRLWSSWEDYMREWCGRSDFRRALPDLLEGEDPDFRAHIEAIAAAAGAGSEPRTAADNGKRATLDTLAQTERASRNI